MLIFKNPTYTVEICSVVKHQYVCLSVSIELPKCSHTVKYINTLPSKYIEYWKPPCSKYQNDREVLMDNFKSKRKLQRGIVEGISTFLGIFSPSECSNYRAIDIINCDAHCPVHILCEACRSEMNDTVSLHMFCSHLIHTATTSVIEEGGSTVQTTVESNKLPSV